MPVEYEDAFPEKRTIVDEFFIKTADDNYITARWCFHQGLNVDFLWLAVHCLEKYIKAALLMNGRNVRKYGHRIPALYADLRPLAPELLPEDLERPEGILPNVWRAETVKDFLHRLYDNGQADNRYQLFGYNRNADDLSKLDQMVFRVRRLCCPLEVYVLGEKRDDAPNLSWREALATGRAKWTLRLRLEEIMSGSGGSELRHALLNWNFPFQADDYKNTETKYMWASANSVLIRRIYDPLEAGPKHFEAADRLWSWVKDSIQMPQDLIKQIENERGRLKAAAVENM
jgi:HEPN domain-containing protein